MSGIAGIAKAGKEKEVRQMLDKIAFRGNKTEIIETSLATLGLVWSDDHISSMDPIKRSILRRKNSIKSNTTQSSENKLLLKRDPLGINPLYYGWMQDQTLCFSSEVKGLLEVSREVHEITPGHTFDGEKMEPYYRLSRLPELEQSPEKIAEDLHEHLASAVEKHSDKREVGAWLSGGLDSSIMATLARPYHQTFHTFAAGVPEAPDVKYARIVANHIKSEHHEVIVQIKDILNALPNVIYHLESFDAWLVRSSILNYLVAGLAAEYVPAVFSGEGGDELFAGYDYLKSIDSGELADELIDITSRLHNTALQRVDRCSAAHGTEAYVAFLDPNVVDYAMRIPVEYKLHDGVEKWILRQSMNGALPEEVLHRPKAKFWQGAGVNDMLAQIAEEQVSDVDFAGERNLPNGWKLNTKEELFYYRIFREHFGEFDDLQWMGRTKGSPVNQAADWINQFEMGFEFLCGESREGVRIYPN